MPKPGNRPQRRGAAKCSDLVVQPLDGVASSRRMPRTVVAVPPPPLPQQQQKQHLTRQKQRCMSLSASGDDDLHQPLQPMRWSKKETVATGLRSRRACGSTLQRGGEPQRHQAAPHLHQQIPLQQMLSRQTVQQDRSEARYHASLQSSQSQLHHQQKQQQLQRAERGIRPCDTVAAGDMEMPDDSDEFDDLVAPARGDCSQPMSSGQRQQQTQPEYLDYDDDEANSADGDGIWEEAGENDDEDEDDFDEDGADDDEVSDDVTESAGNGNYSQQLYQQQQLMQQKQLYHQQQQQQVLRGSCHGVDCRGDEGLTAAMHHRPATSNKLADVMTRRMGQQQQLQQMQQQLQQMQQQQAKKHMQQHQPRLAQFDQRARVHSSPTAGNRTVDPREGKLTGRQRKQQQQVIQERQPQQQSQQPPLSLPQSPLKQYQQQQQPRQPHYMMLDSQAPQQQQPCHTSNSSNDYQQRITSRLILEMVSCGHCNVCRLASSTHGTSFSVTDASGMKQPVTQVIRIAQPGCCSQQAMPGASAAAVYGGSSCSAAAGNAAATAAASTAATATSRRTRRCLNQQLQPE